MIDRKSKSQIIFFQNRKCKKKVLSPYLLIYNKLANISNRQKNAMFGNFSSKTQIYELICESPSISGKIKVILDGRILFASQNVSISTFQYPTVINKHHVLIVQQADSFDIRIDNQSFNHLLTQQKNVKLFQKYQQNIKEVASNKNFTVQTDRKITLSINAIGEGMKKKKNIVQSQNWQQVGGYDINYFKNLDKVSMNSQQMESILHKIEKSHSKTPEEFNTMQNLFATVTIPKNQQSLLNSDNPIQVNQKHIQNTMQLMSINHVSEGIPISNSQTSGTTNPNASEFTTMQALFSTKAHKTCNQEQFNTMQQLFGTVNNPQSTQPNSNSGKKISHLNLMQQCSTPVSPQQFNTMINIFATVNLSQGNQKVIQNVISTLPQNNNLQLNFSSPLEFSTMQQLFATRGLHNIQTPTNSLQNTHIQLSCLRVEPNRQQFPTIHQLFATNKILQNPPNKLSQLPNTNSSPDFNTRQNLFASMNINSSSQYSKPLETNIQNNQTQNPKFNTFQKLNQTKVCEGLTPQQFNTIQNLFKTGQYLQNYQNIKPLQKL